MKTVLPILLLSFICSANADDATQSIGLDVDPSPLSDFGAAAPVMSDDFQSVYDGKYTEDGLNYIRWPHLWRYDGSDWKNIGNISSGVVNPFPIYIYEYSKYGLFLKRKGNFSFVTPNVTLVHGCTLVDGSCPDTEGDREKKDGWEAMSGSASDIVNWSSIPSMYELSVNGLVEKTLVVNTDTSKPFRMNVHETTYLWQDNPSP
jgi:hypothetical protein